MSAIDWLRKKYPVLQYFNLREKVAEQELAVLQGGQEEAAVRAKSSEGRRVMKRVRQFASNAELKLKNGRKLYKLLAQQQGLLTQIIMNNQKLKALDALQDKHFEYLTEVQLSNNEITEMEPLSKLNAPSLEQLDLSSNSLAIIHPLNACHWDSLTTLLLSQNSIVTIESIKFGRFVSLKEINLSDNFLTRVRHLRKELNGNLHGLKKLDLSGNYISDVQSLSECRFVQLDSLDLRNSSQTPLFSIEKISMTERGKLQSISRYQIKVSTDWPRDKLFIYGYRDKSRHKLSVKIEVASQRLKRETVQKGRRLILD